jgi:hypothetical protein
LDVTNPGACGPRISSDEFVFGYLVVAQQLMPRRWFWCFAGVLPVVIGSISGDTLAIRTMLFSSRVGRGGGQGSAVARSKDQAGRVRFRIVPLERDSFLFDIGR